MAPQITIYTDGSSRGNPGRGGYGVVLICGQYRKELSAGYNHTTNNRMELLGVIVALESLKNIPSQVTIYTDSKYVVDAVEKGWLYDWISKNFKGKKNQDLWLRFYKIYQQHNVKFVWVKGHAETVENNRCDELAVQAALSASIKEDLGYIQSLNSSLLI